jgi:vacuolar-type H+-ATPase subunit F/Vma7
MRVVAIGDPDLLRGYALAGVAILPAAGEPAVAAAWENVDSDVGLVLLTPAAREVLEGRLGDREAMWIELPA